MSAKKREYSFNGWFCFLAAVGVWGMICFKTGRLQRSIDGDIEILNGVKSGDPEYQKLKPKIDYLNQVRELILPSIKRKKKHSHLLEIQLLWFLFDIRYSSKRSSRSG